MSGTRAISTTSRRELSSSFFFFLQGKAPKEIHAILTETLACFLPGRAKDLSAPLYGTTRKSVERRSRSSKRTDTTMLVFSSFSCVCSQRYFPDVSASTWLSSGYICITRVQNATVYKLMIKNCNSFSTQKYLKVRKMM